jgi:hypothetical protein
MTRHAIPIVFALAAGACASAGGPPMPRSPLELRQAQTRSFETADARLVLKAALNVLQDEGFVIRHADAELGLVTAVMEWRSSQPNTGLRVFKWIAAIPTWGASLLVPSGCDEFTAIEANVNVTQEDARARLRISLVAKVTDGGGKIRSVRPVDDALLYQRLLAGLDKGVFLEKERL